MATISNRLTIGRASAWLVAGVWLVHGLWNKLLGGSPRHLAIVQSMPGLDGRWGEVAMLAIGAGEVALAAWVLSAWAPRLCAGIQTAALLSMNGLELAYARDLLLWPAALVPVNLLFLALAWTAATVHRPRAWTLAARLRRHPVPMTARLGDCLTLTFAVPADVLRALVPPALDVETVGGQGFVAVAFVEAGALRPVGAPAFAGQAVFLAGYRVFTRFSAPGGRSLRGLYILRSETNRPTVARAGNLLTHYRYHHCNARLEILPEARIGITVRTADGAADVDLVASLAESSLPPGSPFSTVREARRFAGPMPFTFHDEPETGGIVAVRATRSNWTPAPVRIERCRIDWLDRPPFHGCRPKLAAAFHVRDVAYRWHRGIHYPVAS